MNVNIVTWLTQSLTSTQACDFIARFYRAIMSQRATVQLHAATLSRDKKSRTRATKSRDKIAGVTSVLVLLFSEFSVNLQTG